MRLLERMAIAAAAVRAVRHRRRPIREPDPHRIVPAGPREPGFEAVVILLLLLASLAAIAFILFYAIHGVGHRTQWLGVSIGLGFGFVGAALIIIGKRLVVEEEVEEPYSEGEPEEQEKVGRIVTESGSRFTRKRLLVAAGGLAGTTMGVALLAPIVSLGPWFNVDSLYATPWRRGRRLVDFNGRPLAAADIEEKQFYTAFPEGASQDDLGSSLVVVRLDPAALQLPPARARWAPQGILAYSKICTHAGCAISLYRAPLNPPTSPGPALVCPCHYSTFDPATGGTVTFGPAGRDLPQLPLIVDLDGNLRAGGNFSGPIGPSWWGVRLGKATS